MGSGTPKGSKPARNTPLKRSPKVFFALDNRVHKKIFINRAKDVIHAWDFEREVIATYSYTMWLKKRQPIFRTGEVAWMLSRSRHAVKKAVWEGAIPAPVKGNYPIETQAQYLWKESDIMNLLDYFGSRHFGRPRRDGLVRPLKGLPSPREVKAMIHDDSIMYVKQGDKFVPTWRAKDLS